MDTKVRDNFDIGTDFMMRVGDAWVAESGARRCRC
jgi:hypothetical protein